MTAPLSARTLVSRFTRTRGFRRIGPTVMPPLERVVERVTCGRVIISGLLMPALRLHSIGARTGQERQHELMCVPDRGTWLITGSNFARENHPAWTWNLLAHPDVEITYCGKRIPVTASLVPDDEREAVWDTLQRQWPNYREYEVTARRKLRIFRLTRR